MYSMSRTTWLELLLRHYDDRFHVLAFEYRASFRLEIEGLTSSVYTLMLAGRHTLASSFILFSFTAERKLGLVTIKYTYVVGLAQGLDTRSAQRILGGRGVDARLCSGLGCGQSEDDDHWGHLSPSQ